MKSTIPKTNKVTFKGSQVYSAVDVLTILKQGLPKEYTSNKYLSKEILDDKFVIENNHKQPTPEEAAKYAAFNIQMLIIEEALAAGIPVEEHYGRVLQQMDQSSTTESKVVQLGYTTYRVDK